MNYNDKDFNKKDRRKNQMYNLFSNASIFRNFFYNHPCQNRSSEYHQINRLFTSILSKCTILKV